METATLPLPASSLQDLPNELLLQILEHLSLQDLSNLYVMNRHFCRLISDNNREMSQRLGRERYAAHASVVPLPKCYGVKFDELDPFKHWDHQDCRMLMCATMKTSNEVKYSHLERADRFVKEWHSIMRFKLGYARLLHRLQVRDKGIHSYYNPVNLKRRLVLLSHFLRSPGEAIAIVFFEAAIHHGDGAFEKHTGEAYTNK